MSGSAKSVVEIDVRDESFRRFKQMFEEYESALKDSSRLWESAGEATSAAAGEAERLLSPSEAIASAAAAAAAGHEKIASLLSMQSSIMHQIGGEQTDAMDRLTRLLEGQGRSEATTKRTSTLWHGIVDSTRDASHWIADATKDLLKWGTIAGAVGGLLGGGGLFGMDRVGATAGAWRRQAMGLGLGNEIGDAPAFNAFSRFVDPTSFLGGVQSAIQDPTKRLPFSILGMGQPGYNANPASIAAEVIQRLPDYIRSQQAAGRPLQTMFETGQFQNLGISFQDFVRLGQASPGEISDLTKKYQQQADALNKLVTPDVARRWQDFNLQLEFAGQNLKAILIRGLVNLTGPLERLSGSVVNFLEKLTGTKNVDDFVAKIGQGIDKLSNWVNSISQQDIDKFESAVKLVAQDVLNFGTSVIHAITWIDDKIKWWQNLSKSDKPPPAPRAGVDPGGSWFGPNRTLWRNPNGDIVDPKTGTKIGPAGDNAPWGGFGGWLGNLFKPSSFVTPPATWGGGFSNAAFTQVEAANRLPPGTLRAVEWAESRGDPRAVSPAGAEGLFQFMPGTAKDLGINPLDPAQALQGAGTYLGGLFKQFGGDLSKALAAYNEGPGALQSQIGRWGKDWAQHLPAETEHYVEGIMRTMARSLRDMIPGTAPRYPTQPVTVTINNNTGANVHVALGQLGVGTPI